MASLVVAPNCFRRGLAQFKLCAHFLQLRSKRFDLLFSRVPLALCVCTLRCSSINPLCVSELVQQHRVHCFVAHTVSLNLLVTGR